MWFFHTNDHNIMIAITIMIHSNNDNDNDDSRVVPRSWIPRRTSRCHWMCPDISTSLHDVTYTLLYSTLLVL